MLDVASETMGMLEVAKYLNVAPATVRRLLRRKVLRGYRDPAYQYGPVLIARADVEHLARERERLRAEFLAPLERAG